MTNKQKVKFDKHVNIHTTKINLKKRSYITVFMYKTEYLETLNKFTSSIHAKPCACPPLGGDFSGQKEGRSVGQILQLSEKGNT